MKSLLIILLAGYAVRSDQNNYYVIEMQDVPPTPSPPQGHGKKPFNVYWNVPTMQCASKKIYFENLYEDFGIIQNDKDHFKGEKITILYDPGLFPALFKNESGGKIRFRNGGVPQEGNLNKHLDEFKKELDRSIPDKTFSGIGIIDFESWRPQFRQNFGVLQPYKDVSFEIERKLHWWWKEAWIKDEAKRRFEEAARTFMQSTLSVAKKLRPRARWGFYAFPYCFNMATNNLVESCANGVPQENDDISWLWSESSALFPSVYSSAQLSAGQLAVLVRGRVREAARCKAPAATVLPYFWFRYRDAGFLTETDLSTALSMLYKSAASGIIIWGSSNDVNTLEKCTDLKYYVQNVLGPAIAKYTKPIMKDNDKNEDNTTLITDTDTDKPTSNLVSIGDIALDPEFHWMPPENYTQDLKNNVEEQMNKKFGQNIANFSVLQNNSVLIDLILNSVFNSVDNATTTDDPKTKYDKKSQFQTELVVSTTEIDVNTSTGTSQLTSVVTNNPLLNETTNANTKVESQFIEVASSEIPIFDETSTTEKNVFKTDTTNITFQLETETVSSVNESTTTAKTNTDKLIDNDYDVTLDDDDDDFYNSDAFILFFNKETTISFDDHTLNTNETNTDFTKNEKKVQTYTQGLSTKDIETSTEKVTVILTNDESYTLEASSTEFINKESVTENNNISKEATNENEYITEPKIITRKNVFVEETTLSTVNPSSTELATEENNFESSTNNNEPNKGTRSNKYDSNSYILTTTSTSLKLLDVLNLPNETRYVGFETEGLDSSKTESKTTEGTNISKTPEMSTISGSEDTEESTSIVPSTEQVSGASQLKRPYIFCFIFYLYSLSICLCSICGECL